MLGWARVRGAGDVGAGAAGLRGIHLLGEFVFIAAGHLDFRFSGG
jgi:hypothetical protein